MRTTAARVLLGVALLIAAAVLFSVLQDGGDDDGAASGGGTGGEATPEKTGTAPEPSRPAIPVTVVRQGKPVGGPAELSFAAGDPIRFEVKSDVADEIHVHGYDISKEVEAGGTIAFDFPATIEGVFEVELEDRGEQVAELRVTP